VLIGIENLMHAQKHSISYALVLGRGLIRKCFDFHGRTVPSPIQVAYHFRSGAAEIRIVVDAHLGCHALLPAEVSLEHATRAYS
jgi:hypothetical protein